MVGPTNVAVKSGTAATFSCHVTMDDDTESMEWWEFNTDSDAGKRVYDSTTTAITDNRYVVSRSDNAFLLVIQEASNTEAGDYECKIVTTGAPVKARAKLVVLGKILLYNSTSIYSY